MAFVLSKHTRNAKGFHFPVIVTSVAQFLAEYLWKCLQGVTVHLNLHDFLPKAMGQVNAVAGWSVSQMAKPKIIGPVIVRGLFSGFNGLDARGVRCSPRFSQSLAPLQTSRSFIHGN